jgi:3-methyladenine DNA glycosylase AlkD
VPDHAGLRSGPTTPLAATVVAGLVREYSAAADPARAEAMSAYLRGQFPCLGIPAPTQTMLNRRVLAGAGSPSEADLRAVALACWRLPEREYQYFACRWLRRWIRVCSVDFLATVRELIVTRSWWDTVDSLAAHVVGPLVARYPTLVSTMDRWLQTDELWLIRAAILHQLTYRGATDAARLFRSCATHAGHRDFFIRKAIGWALREYARTDPDAVRRFVASHAANLSPLSIREATRHL